MSAEEEGVIKKLIYFANSLEMYSLEIDLILVYISIFYKLKEKDNLQLYTTEEKA